LRLSAVSERLAIGQLLPKIFEAVGETLPALEPRRGLFLKREVEEELLLLFVFRLADFVVVFVHNEDTLLQSWGKRKFFLSFFLLCLPSKETHHASDDEAGKWDKRESPEGKFDDCLEHGDILP